MSKFIFKPRLIDFGQEPCTKTVKFIHECASITIISKPEWVSNVSIDYSPYDTGAPLIGIITAVVAPDSAVRRHSGYIEVRCDLDTIFIPTIYSYDSEHVQLSQIIDDLILSNGDSSYVGERDRTRATLLAMRWLQDNNAAAGTNVRFAELVIGEDSRAYPPADFMDYIGVYTYTSDGYLKPLFFNNNINLGESYVEDENQLIIVDDNGYAISTHAAPKPNNNGPYLYYGANVDNMGGKTHYNIRRGEVSYNGIYRYDKPNRCFHINGAPTTMVVVEYISDPILRYRLNLDIGGLCVHKHYQATIQAYIYSELIANNRYVTMGVKRDAENKYKRLYLLAKRRSLKLNELIQIIRGIV